MKRCIFTSIFLLCCIIIGAQETKQITLTFSEGDFIFTNSNNGWGITSVVHPVGFSNDTTTPALPIIPINVYIEDEYKYDNFSVSFTDTLIRDNIIIQPNQPEIATNGDTLYYDIVPNYTNSIYPEQNIKYSGTNIINGHKIISFLVCPFRYNAINSELYLLNTININIQLNDDISVTNTSSVQMCHSIKKVVVNTDEIITSTNYVYDYDYLIITCDSLKQTFEKLSNWKSTKGIKSHIITIEEIDNIYNENTTLQLKIKKAIKNYYDGEYTGLKHVLLGGDINIVPAQNVFIYYNNSVKIYTANTPADLFYACFDTMDWDTNKNGIVGEISDDIDISPEIIISRLPIKTNKDADIVISRIIDYELYRHNKPFSKNILMSGVKISNYHNDEFGNMISDVQRNGETTYEDYISPYWNGAKTNFYDTGTDFENNNEYDVNSSNLQNELAKGYTFVNMDTHGSPLSWSMEKGVSYNTNNASLLQNKGYTVIITSACHTNAFDSIETCLSEAFITNPYSEVISYIGSSRYGWSSTSTSFNRLFYRTFFNNGHQQIATSLHETKLQTVAFSNIYNAYRWLHMSINHIGDPETPIYLACPKSFDNIKIFYTGDSLTIETGVDDCKICVSSIEKGVYYNVRENISSWSLGGLNDSYYICITKPGYIPYIATAGNEIYLQNQTYTDD